MAPPDRNAEPDDLPDADVDARWSDIVARLGDVEQAGRSAATDPPRPATPVEPEEPTVTRPPVLPAEASGPRDWPTTPEVENLHETESHFVPPEPERVAHRDPLATLTWSIVVVVPVLTVLWVVARAFSPELAAPSWIAPAVGAVFVASVAVLVWRMPHRRDPDDHDPGAVV